MRGLKRGEFKIGRTMEPFVKAVKNTYVAGYDFFGDFGKFTGIRETTCDRCGRPIQLQSGLADYYREKICLYCSPYFTENLKQRR